MTLPPRLFCLVVNDKGGVGKSLVAALVAEQFSASSRPIHLVEVEQHVEFTQLAYSHPPGISVKPVALITKNETSGLTDMSVTPLDSLWNLIPEDPADGSIIVLDCGASAFQALMLWGAERRGLKPFRDAQFRFLSVIPVQAADSGAAKFANLNAPLLAKFGDVVLARNLRAGTDFNMVDKSVLSLPNFSLLYRGRPLTDELQQPHAAGLTNLTFRQLASLPAASRRAKLDAEDCAEHFALQFTALLTQLKIS